MNNIYALRKNFASTFVNEDNIIRGKLAFKTRQTDWLNTESPVIILVSIHSAFHEKISGDLKMNAFLSTIKNHVNGNITILFSDRAHVQTLSLNYQNDLDLALAACLKTAQELNRRYAPYFEGCKVAYWHSYIYQDPSFGSFINSVKNLYQTDFVFQKLIQQEAEASYTDLRKSIFSDCRLFLNKAREDILEQCACALVLAHKGYRFLFYPGSSYASVEYVMQTFVPAESQLSWVDVFLSIEKKTISAVNINVV